MNVSVFGGSTPRPGEAPYEDAQDLGRLLAEAGHTVMTGGYMGTMEAVSRGASKAGGHVIGVTADEIEAWRPTGPNRWVAEERRVATLRERLFNLIDGSDAAIALPGGVGTLAEIALYWNQVIVGAIPRRPLTLVGPAWQESFETLLRSQSPYIPGPDRVWLTFAATPANAVERLRVASAP